MICALHDNNKKHTKRERRETSFPRSSPKIQKISGRDVNKLCDDGYSYTRSFPRVSRNVSKAHTTRPAFFLLSNKLYSSRFSLSVPLSLSAYTHSSGARRFVFPSLREIYILQRLARRVNPRPQKERARTGFAREPLLQVCVCVCMCVRATRKTN